MKKLLFLLVSSAFCSTIFGQWVWNSDPTVNNEVCTTSNTTAKANLVSTSDGAGGMWIAWEDSRNSGTTGTDIYLQRLKHDGSIAFAASGILVCDALLNQSAISITGDGSGGCVLSWTDGRAGQNDVYAQRVTSAGTVAWAANGVAIANTTGSELASVLERVNNTHVMIGWRDDRNNTMFSTGQDYFVNLLSLVDGSKTWTVDYELVRANNTQSNLRLLADGSGNAYAVWQDPRVATTNSDIFVQKINNNGTGAWTNYGVNLTPSATFNQSNPQLISDGAGGIIIAWDDNRTAAADQAIYAQRIDATGTALWTAGGALVVDVTGSNSRNPQLCTDGANGAIITWQDTRNTATTSNDIYAQRISSSGAVLWTPSTGVVVSNAAGSQPNSTSSFYCIADGANGAIIVFDDATLGTSDLDIKAQRFDAMGNSQWASNGTAVATKSGSNQRAPVAVFSATQSVILAWPDARSGTANSTIYASRIFPNGALPLQFVGIKALLNGNTGLVSWETASEVNTSHFMVEKSSDGRTFNSIGAVVAKGGNSNYSLTDKALLTGDNFYRIKSVDKDGQFQYSAIAKLNYGKTGNVVVSIYPNPATTVLNIQTANLEKGKYQIRMLNQNGSVVLTRTIAITNPLQQQIIDVEQLNNGVYLIQLLNNDGASIQTKTFIKQ